MAKTILRPIKSLTKKETPEFDLPPVDPNEPIIGMDEALQELSIDGKPMSKPTLRRLMNKQGLPFGRRGRRVFFYRSQLRWWKTHQVQVQHG